MATPPSIWTLKPWWCQPWSILTTGAVAPLASWWLLHRWWITAAVVAGVLVWWWLFLVLVPASYSRWKQEQDEGEAVAGQPVETGTDFQSPSAEAQAGQGS
jgi:heme/copper-type cytochrome/quinol oxidase subunit 2